MAYLTSFSDGVRITVKAKPRTKKARAWQIVDIGDDKQALEIAIAAQPEGGKANKEICSVLAKTFHVPLNHVDIKTGHTSRIKIIEITGITLNEAKSFLTPESFQLT